MSEIRNKTNAELSSFIVECEAKYKKLLKVANKLATEMDSLSSEYKEARAELAKRQEKK